MSNITLQHHTRNKLTLSNDETRIKLNNTDNERLLAFAIKIDKHLREKNIIDRTLRGTFSKIADMIYIELHTDNGKNIFQFVEGIEEPNVTKNVEEYLLSAMRDY